MDLYMDNAKGERTEVRLPDDTTLAEAFVIVTAPDGVWENHKPTKKAKPKWVASDSRGLTELLAEHYGAEAREVKE